MAKEYIEREATKRELLSWAVSINHPEYLIKDDALHVIDSIPAADANGVTVQEWISVEDRLPEDQEEVLVCTRSKNGIRNIDKGYMAIDRFIHRGRAEVTHWMQMPDLPKGE